MKPSCAAFMNIVIILMLSEFLEYVDICIIIQIPKIVFNS